MVFIDKTTSHSDESRSRLEAWKTDFRHEERPLSDLYAQENQTGDKLWGLLSQDVKDRLREDLNREQEGICCYCCQSLAAQNTKIEHFLVKSAPDCEGEDKIRAFEARVFNYHNLMLSCDGGESSQNPTEVKRKQDGTLETKQDVANRLQVTTDLLDELNSVDKNYHLGEKIQYTKGTHCDSHRGNSTTPLINPTTERDCWQLFQVKNDGSMAVNPSIEDESHRQLIENTLTTVLNLGEPRLKNKRKQAWQKFEDILINEADFQAAFPDPNALFAYLDNYFAIQSQIKAPFCFVNYHFIRDFMNNSI